MRHSLAKSFVLALLVACGGDSETGTPDAASAPDAGLLDAAAADAMLPALTDSGPRDATPEDAAHLGPSVFTKLPGRNFRGQIFEGDASLASDPCVLHDGATWRMVYTCVAGADVGGLCEVTSSDGIAWQPVASIDPAIEGLIARGRVGTGWDENLETCALIREADGLALYYAGYRNLDRTGNRPAAALGRLLSQDGVHFTRQPDGPVLSPTPGGRDADDIFSPTFVNDGDHLDLVYVGWCIDGYHDGLPCATGAAVQLLGATRAATGVFTKRDAPVLAPDPNVAWLRDGVAEPALVRGDDGRYWLFFTGNLGDGSARSTGLAVGASAFGPWQVSAQPILRGESGGSDACGAFAPSVVFDGDKARMWYLALDDCGGTCPSCNHDACGCAPRYSIGYAESPLPLSL